MSTQSTTPPAAAQRHWHLRMRHEVVRHSMAWLLAALVVLFASSPFIEGFENGRHFEGLLVTVVLLAAMLAARGRVPTFAIAIALAVPAVAARWTTHFRSEDAAYTVFIATFVAFIGFVVFHFLLYIIRAPRVNSEVLCAALATYLLLALLWGAAFTFVDRMLPGSFSGVASGGLLKGFNALYFSIITLTTVGYGDIAPVSGAARMLAAMEAITGTLYLAVMISRLVSLYSTEASPNTSTPPPDRIGD